MRTYLTLTFLLINAALVSAAELREMASFPDKQITGVGVSKMSGRVFVCWDPESGRVEQVIADKRLLWPDTLSWEPNGELYLTASQIENMPRFNNGKSTRTEPYSFGR